ncbi:MAG: substrate-binding domain-containing protein, partial [Victivallales bacterium]
IALLGFDNNLLGERIDPALSTIAQQPNKLAEAAVKRLFELIAEPESEPKTIYVPGILIRRKTL